MRKKIRHKMADKEISVSRIKPDKKGEIGGKSRPDKIGDLKICSQLVNPVKLNNHKYNKD